MKDKYCTFWELSWRGRLGWLRGKRFLKPTPDELAAQVIRIMKAKMIADDRSLLEPWSPLDDKYVITIRRPVPYVGKTD